MNRGWDRNNLLDVSSDQWNNDCDEAGKLATFSSSPLTWIMGGETGLELFPAAARCRLLDNDPDDERDTTGPPPTPPAPRDRPDKRRPG